MCLAELDFVGSCNIAYMRIYHRRLHESIGIISLKACLRGRCDCISAVTSSAETVKHVTSPA